MINLETLSGEPFQTIHLNEDDRYYKDLLRFVKKIPTKYPDYKCINHNLYEIYTKICIKLFNKGCEINLDNEINFESNVLQVNINYKYVCNRMFTKNNITHIYQYYFTNTNNMEDQLATLKANDTEKYFK